MLPFTSATVQVTSVEPTEYGPALLTVTDNTEQLSVALAAPIDELDVHNPASVVTFAVAGQVTIGA